MTPIDERRSAAADVMLGLLPALLLPLPAGAVPVMPAPQIIALVSFNQGQAILPATFGPFSVPAPGGGMVLGVQGTPLPAITASGQITANAASGNLFGESAAVLTYFVAIDGPQNAPVPVLVDVAGFASAQASPGATFAVKTGWELLGPGTLVASDLVESGSQTGSFGQGFQRTVAFTMLANNLYQINLRLDVSLAATASSSSAQGSAFIDPFFRFAAGVDPNQFQFVFSSGIGNAPAVPEPASYGLMALGLAVLAARRFTAAAA
jgi:PEP-CTERM motif